MKEMTIEEAIALRNTVSPPTVIINNLLHGEGMGTYVDMACSRILELVDEHPEYQDDIYLDITDFNIHVTSSGFLLVKNILLSYIPEEKWQECNDYLQLKNEQVQSWNNIIKLLSGFSRNTLHEILNEMRNKPDNPDKERMKKYIITELKARGIRNKLRQRALYFKRRLEISMRAVKIKMLLNDRRQQNN